MGHSWHQTPLKLIEDTRDERPSFELLWAGTESIAWFYTRYCQQTPRIPLVFSAKSSWIQSKIEAQVGCIGSGSCATANDWRCDPSRSLPQKVRAFVPEHQRFQNDPCIADKSSSISYASYHNIDRDFEAWVACQICLLVVLAPDPKPVQYRFL